MDKDVVEAFEKAQTELEKGAGKILVESTLYHEATHYGDNLDGKNLRDACGNKIETGISFELTAYGVNFINMPVGNYIMQYQGVLNGTYSPQVIAPCTEPINPIGEQ